MKLNIAIVDDNLADRMRLESFIRFWFSEGDGEITLNRVKCYASGEEILNDFEADSFHIVFMDIIMGSLNGIETARALRNSDTRLLIVFITTSSEYALEAFPVHAFDYILKPYKKSDVNRVMNEAVSLLTQKEAVVTVKVGRNEYKIPVRKIVAAVARDHFVEISLSDGNSLLSNMKFREIEQIFSEHDDFLLCNRGVIVNMSKISTMGNGVFIMKNGAHYPIRKADSSEITAAFSQYLISNMRYIAMGGGLGYNEDIFALCY